MEISAQRSHLSTSTASRHRQREREATCRSQKGRYKDIPTWATDRPAPPPSARPPPCPTCPTCPT